MQPSSTESECTPIYPLTLSPVIQPQSATQQKMSPSLKSKDHCGETNADAQTYARTQYSDVIATDVFHISNKNVVQNGMKNAK